MLYYPPTPVSIEKIAYIDAYDYSIKKAGQFTSIGWVKAPQFASANPLVLLAVSDISGGVINYESSIKVELVQDAGDYRLQFSNALSKKVGRALGIRLDDDKWHFLSYVCTGEGNMLFYVDGRILPAEDGVGEDGLLYSIAWSRSVRQGGGDVWCPYLYEAGQAVSVYNWRFGAGFQLHQQWLQEIMARELPALIENPQ
jgi:hypothetical protein